MGRLIGWELKKLWGRKSVWITLLLCTVLFVLGESEAVTHFGLSGHAQGYRDVYQKYLGQTITEKLKKQITEEFTQYIQAHADSFTLEEFGDDQTGIKSTYFPSRTATGYDNGVWDAYNDLSGAYTVEEAQESLAYAKERLSTGKDEHGKPLKPDYLRAYQEEVHVGLRTPVVSFTRGWDLILSPLDTILGLAGYITLLTVGMALLGLFNTEATSRMEVLVLTAKHSRRVVWVKLITGVLVSIGVAALFFGLQYAVSLGIWGTEGSMLPADSHRDMPGSSAMTMGQSYALSMLFLLAMATACGAIVAWASARFRRPLVALLAAGAILGGMALAQGTWVHSSYRLASDFWAYRIDNALLLLPSIALIQTDLLPYRAYTMPWPLLELGVPLAMTVLFSLFAYRAFLRRPRI